MKKHKLSVFKNTLLLSADFVEAMNDLNSPEYRYYKHLVTEFPGLKVSKMTHSTPKKYKSHQTGAVTKRYPTKNLTFERMEAFIRLLPDCEEYLDNYSFLRSGAGGTALSAYALTCKWFMRQFPKFRATPEWYLYNHPLAVSAERFISEETEAAA